MDAQSKSLYLQYPDVFDFNSKIVGIDKDMVTLESTYFYPRGGGQCGDSGHLTFKDGVSVDVLDTMFSEDKSVIIHRLANPISKICVGQNIHASIDSTIRINHNRLHTALHLITAFINAPVTGCRIAGNECSIDFNLPEMITSKDEVNLFLTKQVTEDHVVNIFNMSPQEYRDSKYYNSILACPDEENLRIVYIDSVDSQPCCGTHVHSTKEIGKIECFKIKSHGKKNRRFSFRIMD